MAKSTAPTDIEPKEIKALLQPGRWQQFSQMVYAASHVEVQAALNKPQRSLLDLAALLSPAAAEHMESIAQAAQTLTKQRFGRTVVLYVPLYLSNACNNCCVYCGFSHERDYPRRTLELPEIEREIQSLKAQGFDHILLLTGEDRSAAPVDFLRQVVARCHQLFASVGIEVYPMQQSEYAQLVAAGCDSLTLYQESYHQEIYRRVHPKGPKAHFANRIKAPDTAAQAGMRSIGIGALLGLADWRVEAMFLALHGQLLRQKHWRCRLSIGFPRLREQPSGLSLVKMTEPDLLQMVCALRLFFPDADLVLSTRERQIFRDGMVGLGITRMSAGSKTQPGGYALQDDSRQQFAVTDERSPAEVAAMLEARGYEPIWKDFDQGFLQ